MIQNKQKHHKMNWQRAGKAVFVVLMTLRIGPDQSLTPSQHSGMAPSQVYAQLMKKKRRVQTGKQAARPLLCYGTRSW